MLSKEQKERYRRQIAVVGEDGQEKIGKTRLLIAGAGGLGSALPSLLPWQGLALSVSSTPIASKRQT